ncbi:helix-turn-helix transcriptional regulator [Sphingobium sp. H39-3-25]|uniref:helix-turn-helix transcriptional regulator n=1 Tax=Sphingobium arseniciresistens TaxID=3030834 RepID=UPI0023B9A6B9|nr:helix-turn-helix transcriptional regulator [Sphingobium arseniciresistens]
MDQRVFSELVSAIYDGAVDVSLWPDALGRICETFGFRKGTIDLNRMPGITNLFNFHYGIDDQQAATMVSHYQGMPDVWGGVDAVMTRPINQPWVVSRIISQEALVQTPYYNNWVGPMGLVDGAAIVLARDPNLFGSMRLATDAKGGIIDDGLIGELALLLPHCQRAARISGLLDASRSIVHNFQAVIDSMSVPIVLVSIDCAVVHANARAKDLMEEGVILASRYDQLSSPVPGLRHAIGNAISRLAKDETDIPGSGTGLSIRLPDHFSRAIHLLPLANGALRARLNRDAVAAIFISNAPIDQNLEQDVLQSMFGLTNAELAVFERIFAGGSTRDVAAELGIAYSTVRTHILRLFQKTATHSRADLIRLAHAYTKPIA